MSDSSAEGIPSIWLEPTTPLEMLEAIKLRATDRKLRLFAIAYAKTASSLMAFHHVLIENYRTRRSKSPEEVAPEIIELQQRLLELRSVKGRLDNPISFQGTPPLGERGVEYAELAEKVAEGDLAPEILTEPREAMQPEMESANLGAAYCGPSAHLQPEQLAVLASMLAPSGYESATGAIGSVSHFFVSLADSGPLRRLNPTFREPVIEQTRLLQRELLREIFGNPFQPISVNPQWLNWNNGTVEKVAQVIYRDQRFEDLPILADALEEAGCEEATMLEHCRQARHHVKGCWVLDCLLSKE